MNPFSTVAGFAARFSMKRIKTKRKSAVKTQKKKRFNGRYFVTGTRHTFGPQGYHTYFTCRREES